MAKIILLGGPTASGKSTLSLKWAAQYGGEIINADSMQVYRELNILTACPSMEEMKEIPHHLYRTLKGDDPCSADRWREMARTVIEEVWARGNIPIVVGGTGLYLKALVYGLSKVPSIDQNIRAEIRASMIEEGSKIIHARLFKLDQEMANRLDPNDSQRVARALEVILSTHKSLSYWQAQPEEGGLIDDDVQMSLRIVERDRAALYQRCNHRFKMMIEQGDAIKEVKALMELNYSKSLPVMKSLGVPQIINYLEGDTTLDQAIILSQTATRQFAKRQMTWFRNQFSQWQQEIL